MNKKVPPTTAGPSGFGAATSGFGAAAAKPTGFGFGAATQQPGAAATGFGAAAAPQSTFGFGSSSATPATGKQAIHFHRVLRKANVGIFQKGGLFGQPQQQQQQQQQTSLFGGGPSAFGANTTGATGFGAPAQQPQTTGFSFGAPKPATTGFGGFNTTGTGSMCNLCLV
jgi:hypothetical protein